MAKGSVCQPITIQEHAAQYCDHRAARGGLSPVLFVVVEIGGLLHLNDWLHEARGM